MLKIGEFSRLAQVTVKALRHYDRLGLLRPVWIDRYTGYRYYALEQLARLHRILALKDLGLSLEEVKRLLDADVPVAELRGMLHLRQADLQQRLRTERARLARVEARLAQLERSQGGAPYEVVLKALPALHTASIRSPQLTPLRSASLAALIGELQAHLSHRGVAPVGPPMVIYHDAEYRARDADIEVALPLTPQDAARRQLASERVQLHSLPACREAACTLHTGPLAALPEAYAALSAWVPANAYGVAGPPRDVYLSAAAERPTPDEAVVEVQIPVQSIVQATVPGASEARGSTERSLLMQPRIVSFPGVTVVGAVYIGNNQAGEIHTMWDALGPRWAEFEHPSGVAYGVCRTLTAAEAADAPEGAFAYLAGAEQRRPDHVPAGMQVWQVPAGLYAVFGCTLPTISEAYRYGFETWLPASEAYTHRPAPDFELYPPTFDPAGGNQEMEIYIPIQPK